MGNDFEDLLDQYLDPDEHYSANARMAEVRIEWVRDQDEWGAKHMLEKHNVTEAEVMEVLLEIPPEVETLRHKSKPKRTLFFGETRMKRCLLISCEDVTVEDRRTLTPITAFSPEEGWTYWESLKRTPAKRKGAKKR